ncbi:AAA family ATPase [Nocardia crassostreae]|uniref:AAA family ATPase n=1 Tax=Nocardia crassostreae TaxID=53428 RepID=UPI00083617C7|nr:LuxR family transcriptional regulator [Nocardia crassostreae]
MLYGRAEELRRIGALLEAAASGRSAALVVVGDAGEGKTALLDAAARLTTNPGQVLRCAGVESESELPFAGLQSLLRPVLDRVDALPESHRQALRGAFGMSATTAADRFTVGLATISLLAELTATGSTLCLIDDPQWLDRPSADALRFAAHRLGEEAAVLLFATRPEMTGVDVRRIAPSVPQLRLTPLSAADSRALLHDRFPELAPEVRDRVLAAAAGNPLAVVELPRMDLESCPAGPLPIPDRLRTGYAEHIAAQPDSARWALLVAAAEETGKLAVVRAALARLELGEAALTAAVDSCMITISGQTVAFRHPLKRAAAYQLASFTQRLAAHAAIADALEHDDPDRRAWHLALATPVPEENVAAALEAAAERAYHRAAYGAAASAIERAAQLTPDRFRQDRRLTRAAAALFVAGRPEQAIAVADRIDATALDIADQARLRNLRAHIAFENGALTTAYDLWLTTAAELAPEDPERAAAVLVDAARAAWTVGDLAGAQLAHARMSALALDDSWAPLLAAVEGPNRLFAMDLTAGVRMIRDGVAATRATADPATRFTLALLCALAGDTEDAHDLLTAVAAECGQLGRVARLPAVHASLGTMQLLLGHFREAEASCLEAVRMAEGTGQPNRVRQAESVLAVLAALRGDEERCRTLADRLLRRSRPDVNTIDAAHGEWALLLLDLAHGRYEASVHRGEALGHSPHRPLGQWPHLLADRVEAAVRLREPERAAEPLDFLRRYAEAAGSAWLRGLLLRCEAQLAGYAELFEQALKVHAAANRRFDHARTELLYGEWLRRERRQLDARARLESAAAAFDGLGARPWAERARAELRAAGGDPRRLPGPPAGPNVPAGGAVGHSGTAPSDPMSLLTPQELQVVRLAARGATNNEIGAQLCLSPKTVGHHLYRAFPKLGVKSRVELARLAIAEVA